MGVPPGDISSTIRDYEAETIYRNVFGKKITLVKEN